MADRLFEQGSDVDPNLLDRVASGRAANATKNHTWQRILDWLIVQLSSVFAPISSQLYGIAKLDIGAWDMDAEAEAVIDISSICGTTLKLLSAKAYIYPDTTSSNNVELVQSIWNGAFIQGGKVSYSNKVSSIYIYLDRFDGGIFDSTAYNDAVMNRGYIVIIYEL